MDKKTFAQPPLVRTLSIWGATVSGLALASIVISRMRGAWENDALQILSLGFCLLSFCISITMLRGSRVTFVATEGGLWQHSPGKPSQFLRWEDIGDVHSENVMQRLVIADRAGKRRLAIEFHLQGFGELRRIILEQIGERV